MNGSPLQENKPWPDWQKGEDQTRRRDGERAIRAHADRRGQNASRGEDEGSAEHTRIVLQVAMDCGDEGRADCR